LFAIASASDRSLGIEGLRKWVQYKIWVTAFTRKGDGPFSDAILVHTDEDGRYDLMVGTISNEYIL